MAETRGKVQLPMPEVAPRPSPDEDAFQRGLMMGREVAENAVRKIGAWAEENPGQLVLAGLAFGFVLGKILLRRPRTVSELEE
ncbi:MAG TPA: hypothetical protein VEP66_03110 [Myxococcales bacterium]|nr:hypothetical protein [Myxococcales bacterium]